MNLRFLETLIWVAQLRSFRSAAERLNASQPAVSARIAALEEELGTQLFLRDTREVHLTPHGAEALRYAERILDLVNELKQRMANPAEYHGVLRVGVIDTIVHTWLPHLIERLRERHPLVTVEMTADTSLNLAQDLIGGRIDVGLMMGPVEETAISNIPLCSYGMAWVCHPDLFCPEGPIHVTDLARLPIITYPRRSKPYSVIETYFSRPGLPPVALNGSNSLATIIRLTTDKLGVAAIPPVLIPRQLAEGTLIRLPVIEEFPPLDFHVCYRTRPGDPVAKAVADMAVTIAAEFCAQTDPALATVTGSGRDNQFS